MKRSITPASWGLGLGECLGTNQKRLPRSRYSRAGKSTGAAFLTSWEMRLFSLRLCSQNAARPAEPEFAEKLAFLSSEALDGYEQKPTLVVGESLRAIDPNPSLHAPPELGS